LLLLGRCLIEACSAAGGPGCVETIARTESIGPSGWPAGGWPPTRTTKAQSRSGSARPAWRHMLALAMVRLSRQSACDRQHRQAEQPDRRFPRLRSGQIDEPLEGLDGLADRNDPDRCRARPSAASATCWQSIPSRSRARATLSATGRSSSTNRIDGTWPLKEQFTHKLDKSIYCRCRNSGKGGILSHLMVSPSELAEHRNDPSQHRLTLCVFQQQPVLRTLRDSRESMRIPTPSRERSRRSGADRHWSPDRCLRRCSADRLRGTQRLVPRGPIAALPALDHLVCPRYMPDRNPVDIALLMPESHFFSDYDNDNDNVWIPCATYC